LELSLKSEKALTFNLNKPQNQQTLFGKIAK
jgi:hypothetical protein